MTQSLSSALAQLSWSAWVSMTQFDNLKALNSKSADAAESQTQGYYNIGWFKNACWSYIRYPKRIS